MPCDCSDFRLSPMDPDVRARLDAQQPDAAAAWIRDDVVPPMPEARALVAYHAAMVERADPDRFHAFNRGDALCTEEPSPDWDGAGAIGHLLCVVCNETTPLRSAYWEDAGAVRPFLRGHWTCLTEEERAYRAGREVGRFGSPTLAHDGDPIPAGALPVVLVCHPGQGLQPWQTPFGFYVGIVAPGHAVDFRQLRGGVAPLCECGPGRSVVMGRCRECNGRVPTPQLTPAREGR